MSNSADEGLVQPEGVNAGSSGPDPGEQQAADPHGGGAPERAPEPEPTGHDTQRLVGVPEEEGPGQELEVGEG